MNLFLAWNVFVMLVPFGLFQSGMCLFFWKNN